MKYANAQQSSISTGFGIGNARRGSRIQVNISQKNYSLNQSGYQLKLPLNFEIMIPENDSVRLLSQFVEAMDLTDLYSTYE